MVAPGTKIGPYEVIGELGRGGMGVVLRVRRPDLQRDFALKVILPGKDATPEALERFRREARAAARLAGHPGIVGVHNIGEEDGKVYFAMDLVEGASLDRLIDQGELTPRRAAEIVGKAARALHHAHTHGVLHRDVKPGNILVTPTTEVRITDFGLAQTQDSDADAARLTKAGSVLGTPAYLSPEQANGDTLDTRADIYSLGATLYESLTGEPPFVGDTVYTVLARIQRDEPRPPRRLDPRVPRDLETIALKCIEKDRERRYSSAKELADDLDRFLQNEPISARPATVGYRLRKRVARHPVAWLLGSLAAIGLAIVGAMAFWVLVHTSETQRQLAEEERKKRLAEWANLIAGAYYEMSIKTTNEMQELEDLYHGVPLPASDLLPPLPGESKDPLRRRLEKIERVSRQLMDKDTKYESVRIHDAWRGLAFFYAGREGGAATVSQAMAEITDINSEDPFPALLWGRLNVARLLRDLRCPPAAEAGGALSVPPLAFSEPQQALVDAAVPALTEGKDRAVWTKLQHSREYQDYAKAVLAFVAGEHATVVQLCDQLQNEPILRAEKFQLRGLACYWQGDFDGAVAGFTALIDRPREVSYGQTSAGDRAWPIARYNRAVALVARGRARQLAAGMDPDRSVELAVADFRQAAEQWAAVGRGADAKAACDQALELVAPDGAEAEALRALRASVSG